MADGNGKRILIVSNDEQHAAELRELFESDGYAISTTWSGRDALYELQSQHFDALMVDDYLPDLFVGQFIERVGRHPLRACLIVVQGHHARVEAQHLGPPETFFLIEKADPTQMVKAVELALLRGNAGRTEGDQPVRNGEVA